MKVRAASAEASRQRILDAAFDLLWEADYDSVTLERVAAHAQVSLQTVLRKFGSKEQLVLACARERHARETDRRTVTPGDVRGVVRALAARYEALAAQTHQLIGLESRLPAVATALMRARAAHRGWLAAAFAPHLPRQGVTRKRRLAELFGATEIYVWWTWREKLGLSKREAERALLETLEALLQRWQRNP